MLQQSIARATRQVGRQSRLFSTSLRTMAEGDTGSPRTGGAVQGDAFTKREQASEDYYVRQQELQKLQALRKKLQEQQKNITELQKDIDTMIDKSGNPKQ